MFYLLKKTRKSIFLLFFLIAVLPSCDQSLPQDSYPYWNLEDESDAILANSIAKRVLEKLKAKRVFLCQCGWAMEGRKKIKSLSCTFFHYKEVDVEEARNLVMLITNLFLQEINANGRIQPYLEDIPFVPTNLEVVVVFKNKDGSSMPSEKLCIVVWRRGLLDFSVDRNDQQITVLKETYAEAMEKVDPASRCGL